MIRIRAFNADALTRLADYASRALYSRYDTGRRVTASQEAVVHSRALIADADALFTELTRKGWLWPRTAVAGDPAAGIALSPD
jgi:hypothetical protein